MEYIESNKLLTDLFEPKSSFRWIFEVEGLDVFVLHSIECPTFNDCWQSFQVTMVDPIIPSCAQKVYNWLKSGEKRKGCLKLLDPVANVVEKWNYEGLSIVSVNFGKLDYSKSDPKKITLILDANDISLEF